MWYNESLNKQHFLYFFCKNPIYKQKTKLLLTSDDSPDPDLFCKTTCWSLLLKKTTLLIQISVYKGTNGVKISFRFVLYIFYCCVVDAVLLLVADKVMGLCAFGQCKLVKVDRGFNWIVQLLAISTRSLPVSIVDSISGWE